MRREPRPTLKNAEAATAKGDALVSNPVGLAVGGGSAGEVRSAAAPRPPDFYRSIAPSRLV
jgi:hypothetical protein